MYRLNLRNKHSLKHQMRIPPPEYLRMPAAGVNISDHSIKCLQFSETGDLCHVQHVSRHNIPDGVVEAGDIKKPKAVARALSKLKEKGVTYVRFSIPEEKAFIFTIELPYLEEREIRSALEFQITEHVPLAAEDIVFDFDVIKAHKRENRLDVSVSALPRQTVDQYLALCEQSGLIPLSFEIEAQTVSKALVRKGDTAAYMIVDIGRTRTGISIVENEIVRYTSTLNMGGDTLTDVIRKHHNISFEEADEIKQKKGFLKSDEDLYFSLVNAVSAFRDEINRRISYWETHRKSSKSAEKKISRMIVCGGNATVPGLVEHFSQYLEVEAELGDVWVNVFSLNDCIPQIPFNESFGFAAAIGLALSDES